jgi:hypothetical protein
LFAPSPQQAAFDPDKEPFASFHLWIDHVLTRDRKQPIAIEHAPSTEIPKRFRRELVATIRTRQDLLSRDWRLSRRTLDRLGPLLSNKAKAVRFLRDAKVPRAQRFAESPRRLLYALAATDHFRSEEDALRRLAQSIFAAVYCDAEDADGVYNSLLIEPPSSYDPGDTERIHRGGITISKRAIIDLRPGIGNVLVEARNSPAAGKFITANSFDGPTADSALDHYAHVFARLQGARRMSSDSTLAQASAVFDKVHGHLVAVLFCLSTLASGDIQRGAELGDKALATLATVHSLAYVGKLAMKLLQSRKRDVLAAELRIAMDQRVHRVKLLSNK